jgi:dTDP-4-dehydrorhamnose reductase
VGRDEVADDETMTMRVLITGAAGALGRDLERVFAPDHEVFACDRAELDVTDRDRVLQVIRDVRPDAIVHSGAWTDVDGCESDVDRAWAVNALGTRHVAEAAARAGAHLVHVSTDYVFDGSTDRPYAEWHAANPRSVYGRSKRGGEIEAITLLGADAAIVRTSWLCGRDGRNFVKTMLDRAAARATVDVVDDQHGCPTFTDDLAGMIRVLVTSRRPGLFHITNQGATTWYRLACETYRLAGADVALVHPISTAELDPPRPAPRPAYSVLDNAALRLSGIPLLPDHHEPLERLVKVLTS